MPRISVVIPAYNNGEFIAETIETVRAQTLPADEIIVVDDGSTDETESVVSRIRDARLQYHRQPNSGVSVARNLGIELATGDFISFLDADDRWRPHTLSRQVQIMQSRDDLICCFGNFVRFLNATGEVLPDQFNFYPELAHVPVQDLPGSVGSIIVGNAFEQIITFGDFPAFTQTMMFRASMIRDVRFDPRLIRCQDADFVLRVFMRGRVAFTDEILAEVRRHSTNATRDVGMMTVDKLRALQCVREDSRVEASSPLLEQRITRAYFDAAGSLLRRGRYREALSNWATALRSGGLVRRKLTGSARLALLALKAAVLKEHHGT